MNRVSHPTAFTRPALAPSASSWSNRMVPPLEPPVFEILSYVPEECHASLPHVNKKTDNETDNSTTKPMKLQRMNDETDKSTTKPTTIP